METKCCVDGCNSNFENNKGIISFITFPTNLEKRQLWLKNLGKMNWLPTKTSVICSLHFGSDNCFQPIAKPMINETNKAQQVNGNYPKLEPKVSANIIEISDEEDFPNAKRKKTEKYNEINETHSTVKDIWNDVFKVSDLNYKNVKIVEVLDKSDDDVSKNSDSNYKGLEIDEVVEESDDDITNNSKSNFKILQKNKVVKKPKSGNYENYVDGLDLIFLLKSNIPADVLESTQSTINSLKEILEDNLKKLHVKSARKEILLQKKFDMQLTNLKAIPKIDFFNSKIPDTKETVALKNKKLCEIVEDQKNYTSVLLDIATQVADICSLDHFWNYLKEKKANYIDKLERIPPGLSYKNWKGDNKTLQKKEEKLILNLVNKTLKQSLYGDKTDCNDQDDTNNQDDKNDNSDEYKDQNNKFDLRSDSSSSEDDDNFFKFTIEKSRNSSKHKRLDNGNVQCTICNKVLKHITGFYRHLESHDQYSTLCSICGLQFKTHSSLGIHARYCRDSNTTYSRRKFSKINTNLALFRCHNTGCWAVFHNEFKLIEHIAAHEGRIPYKCGCGRRFKYYHNLYYHLEHSKGNCSIISCTLPEKVPVFDTYEEFLKVSQSGCKHSCSYCQKQFPAFSKWRDHENIHKGEKPYVCDTCGKSFSSSTGIKLHCKDSKRCPRENVTYPDYCNPFPKHIIRKQSKESKECSQQKEKKKPEKKMQHFCNECNIQFKDHKAIRVHYERVHMEKKITCTDTECLMKFATKALYKQHVKHKHMKYKCDICKISDFSDLSTFSWHNKKFHTTNSDGLFKCNICKKTFEKSLELIEHAKSYHQRRPKKIAYRCLVCDKKYSSLKFIQHFMNDEHKIIESEWCTTNNITKLECNSCSEAFKFENLTEYLMHFMILHGERHHYNNLLNLQKKHNTKLF